MRADPRRRSFDASSNLDRHHVGVGRTELVGHLDVKDDGELHVQCAGAFGAPENCKIITSTMEGGKKAFKDCQKKYGY